MNSNTRIEDLRPRTGELSKFSCLAGELEDTNLHLGETTGALSRGQLELWLLEELSVQNAANNQVTISVIDSRVDEPTLVELLQLLLVKYPIWRTTFGLSGGRPVQRICAEFDINFTALDCSDWSPKEYQAWLAAEMRVPFQLSKSVFRCCLLRDCHYSVADSARNLLVIFLPHIVADFSCVELYLADLNRWFADRASARSDALKPRPTFLEFARREADLLAGPRGQELREYWAAQLASPPDPLALPYDNSRGDAFGTEFRTVELSLPRALSERLRLVGRRSSATPYVTLLAAYFTLLHRYTQAEDIVVGTPVSMKPKDFRETIGLFANVLPVRVALGAGDSFVDVLGRVAAAVAGARSHMHLPLAEVLRLLGFKGSSPEGGLFQATFAWERIVLPEANRRIAPGQPQIARHLASYQHGTNSALSVLFYDDSRDFSMRWNFDSERFQSETVERLAESFATLLSSIADAPDAPIGLLELLSEPDRDRLQSFAEGPRRALGDSLVHELFERHAAATPHARAVVQGAQALSYSALNQRANRLAHRLRRLGVGPEQRVAICAERSLAMVVAVLAVWKAGGAYVPLDAAYPPERQRHMLSDSAPVVLLGQKQLLDTFSDVLPPGTELLDLDQSFDDEPVTNLHRGILGLGSRQLAYVIYTSGSTGLPKGAMLEHRGLCNLADLQARELEAGPASRVLQFASFSFDGWVFELVLALACGGQLCLPEGATPPVGHTLLELVARHQISHAIIPPAVLASLPERATLSPIRVLISSGDALSQSLVSRWSPGRRLINGYGPTETTVCATLHDCSAESSKNPPIGRPIVNTQIHVLDGSGRPVPPGVTGEIYIGGVGVARRYLNRAELDAERFIVDPFCGRPGERLYRTGDLGRWSSNGELEFIGRRDAQVKIRGYRVELAEIEACLREHADVREAVVVARQDGQSEKRLVAYVLAETALAADELRAHVSSRLPEHLLPAAFVRLDRLPLTPNGKVDRRALPAPLDDAYASRPYVTPEGETEVALAELWSELLGVERVGSADNFFELGGHSLLAVTLCERLRARGLHVDVRAVFSAGTLSELGRAVRREHADLVLPPNQIPADCVELDPEMLTLVKLSASELSSVVDTVPGGAANVQDIYPLGPLQEGVFFHHLLVQQGDAYLSNAEFAFDSRARLDAFVAALQTVVDRHDVLRTAIVWEGCPEPVQVVWRKARLDLEEGTLDPGSDALTQLRERFDPRRTRLDLRRAPLLRLCAAEDAAHGRWLLSFGLHHLAGDHTMLDVMREEIRAILAGEVERLPAPQPYRTLVARARLGDRLEEQQAFFRALLADIDEPTAPFGLTGVYGDGSAVEEHHVELSTDVGKRLRERARRLGVSAASLCHEAWALVLSRLTGRESVVFGTVLLGRAQVGQEQRGMGLFINTLPVRFDVGSASAEAVARKAHGLLAELMRHEHASLALAQRCSAVAAPAPLFTSLLNYRRTHAETALTLGPQQLWEGVHVLSSEERSNYPFSLTIDDFGEVFGLTALAPASVGARRVCELMAHGLLALLDALESAPNRALREIDVLPESERGLLLEQFAHSRLVPPTERRVHELFEEQVCLSPDAPAIEHGRQVLSYAELDARASALAQHLRALGVGPDQRVAICADRSPELVVGMLAVLKAGGAYVPLDPAYPAERLDYMLKDCQPRALLFGRERAAALTPIPDVQMVLLGAEPPAAPPVEPVSDTPQQLAYVIYTSGSTGKPKGVMVEHRQLVSLIDWHVRAFGLTRGTRSSSLAGVGFDAAAWEIWPTLCSGGTLLLPTVEAGDPQALLTWWGSQELDVSFLPTPLAHHAFAHGISPRRLRYLLVGGDRLSQLPPDAAFTVVNNYGPTETTVVATSGTVTPDDGVLHIGRPIDNTRVYILDAQRRLVPRGVTGEIYIGGAGVARGYLGQPALSEERFLPDPFGADDARMYRSGDLGRWLPDGRIEFLGRNDSQVKIRGFRIELGEIEARLREQPMVREAVVVARRDRAQELQLVAYVTMDSDSELSSEQLGAWLRASLPEYMVPRAFVRLGTLPLTPHGKIDQRQLPAPEGDAYATREYAAPEGETETALAQIWCELLPVSRVGRHDDFFDLGGHSLLVTRLLMRVNQHFGVALQLSEVFAAPILKALSEKVLDAQLAQFDASELDQVRVRVID